LPVDPVCVLLHDECCMPRPQPTGLLPVNVIDAGQPRADEQEPVHVQVLGAVVHVAHTAGHGVNVGVHEQPCASTRVGTATPSAHANATTIHPPTSVARALVTIEEQ
jgi:hypothetical protein